ncbi:MAG TPA: hypothetical protein V6D48_19085 [Oculatellaceae cyanobacterium]
MSSRLTLTRSPNGNPGEGGSRQTPLDLQQTLKKESLNLPTAVKEYISGEGFFYLGRSYRLKLVDDVKGQPPLRLSKGASTSCSATHRHGGEKKKFIRWYCDIEVAVLIEVWQRSMFRGKPFPVMPEGFDWQRVSNEYLKKVRRIVRETPELRSLLELQLLEELVENWKLCGGLSNSDR